MKTLKYHIPHLWEYFQISDNLDMFVKHLVYNINEGCSEIIQTTRIFTFLSNELGRKLA